MNNQRQLQYLMSKVFYHKIFIKRKWFSKVASFLFCPLKEQEQKPLTTSPQNNALQFVNFLARVVRESEIQSHKEVEDASL